MINKVVIAAAGQGTRMKELTKNKSKHLLNVKDKPFLYYLMSHLLEAGYKELILVVGFRADLIKDFVKEYGFDKNVTFVNQHEMLGPKKEIYGTLCPIKCVQDIIEDENFIAVYGDNMYSVRDLKEFNIDDDYNYITVKKVEHPEKYGVAVVDDDGFLEKIVEKPKDYMGDLINLGLYKFTPRIFEKLPQVGISPRGEYELTDAITLLAEEKRVKAHQIKDYWLDFGNPKDISKVEKFLKEQ